MTGRRRLLLILGGGLLLAAMGLVAASQSPWARRHALVWVEARLVEALGREVRVEEVRLEPWLGRMDLRRIQVARTRSLADGTLFTADGVQVRWSWTALLRRQFVLRRLLLTRPRLTLPATGGPAFTAQDILSALLQVRPIEIGDWIVRLGQAAIQDGQVTWVQTDGTPGDLEGLEGELHWGTAFGALPSPTGRLRAGRLRAMLGGAPRDLSGISLELSGTGAGLGIRAGEFSLAGARVTAQGRVAEPGGIPRLDLQLGVQAPLDALLTALQSQRQMEGGLTLDGRLRGPLEQLEFQGEGDLRFGKAEASAAPLRFSLRWIGGRLEAATPVGAGNANALQGRVVLEPATGTYQARASLANADLAALTGLPAAVAELFGLHVPPGLRGRATADADLTGQGTNLTALRGHVNLRVNDLGVAGETPTGRLEARLLATSAQLSVETFSLKLPGGDIQGRGGLNFASGQFDLPLRADLRDMGAFGRGFGVPLLGGRATLQGRLGGTREAPRLQGRLAWREARIAAQRFDLIDGPVEATARGISSPRLLLRTGRTTVTLRGSILARGTTPLRKLDPKRDLVLDLQGQVNPGRTADFVALLPSDLDIQGAFRASGRLTGTLEALTGDVELALENVRTWEEAWQRGDALLHVRQGALDITRISLRRGEEQLTGEIGIAGDGALQGRLTSTPIDLAKAGSLSGSQLAGRAAFRLDFQGTLRDTRTLGQASIRTLRYRDIPLGPGTATFTLEHNEMGVDLSFREGTHRLQLTLGPPPNRSLRADLALRNADLDLVLRLADFPAAQPWQPRGSGRIRLRGPAKDLTASQGEADFERLRLRFGSEAWENQGVVQAAWSGHTLSLTQFRLRSGEHSFDARGSVGERNQIDLFVTGHLPLLVLASALPVVQPKQGVVLANVHLRGPWSAPDLQGGVEIQQGILTLAGFPSEFQQVQASLNLQGSLTEVRDWQARLAEGQFRGAAEIRRRGERWELRTTFQEEDGRAEQLLAGVYGGKGEVTGTLSLGGILSSQGESPADFWRNLDGELRLSMRNGRIGRYTVLAKLLSLLNVVQLLDLKGPELTAEAMPYQSLTANVKIQRGIARTEDLILESRAMKVNAVGAVNLAEDSVNMTVALKPFQTVDSIITKIPLAGWLLGGKEKSLVVAYYQVTGPLKDPQVTPIPLKSVGRNVFGIFRNLLDIPEALTSQFEDLPAQSPKGDEGQKR